MVDNYITRDTVYSINLPGRVSRTLVETLMTGISGVVSTTLVAVDSNLPDAALRPRTAMDLFTVRSIILRDETNPINNFSLVAVVGV